MKLLAPATVYLTALLSTLTNAAYDQNRAGAVLKAPEDDSFTSVTGTFTVPSITGSNKLSIWVAIGDTLQQDVVLRGGVHYAADGTLSTFVSWFPGNDTDISAEVPVAAGDAITVTVTVPEDKTAGGTVVVANAAQGAESTQTVPLPDSVADPEALTALAADWFVQAYQANGELVQVPEFGSVTFTEAGATLASGTEVGTTGAGTFEIQGTSGQIYSSTSVEDSGVTVTQSSPI